MPGNGVLAREIGLCQPLRDQSLFLRTDGRTHHSQPTITVWLGTMKFTPARLKFCNYTARYYEAITLNNLLKLVFAKKKQRQQWKQRTSINKLPTQQTTRKDRRDCGKLPATISSLLESIKVTTSFASGLIDSEGEIIRLLAAAAAVVAVVVSVRPKSAKGEL